MVAILVVESIWYLAIASAQEGYRGSKSSSHMCDLVQTVHVDEPVILGYAYEIAG
jgi:hypothetical protein